MAAERIPPHPDPRDVPLQQALEALIEPVRRSVVGQLAAGASDIACGAFDLAVSKSTATHHFRVLREAGLIRQYYTGTSRMNALRREEFDAAFPGLLDAVLSAAASETTAPRKTAAAVGATTAK